jgi:hypothetical protein
MFSAAFPERMGLLAFVGAGSHPQTMLDCMKVAWKDLNGVEAEGRYPFRDGTIEVTRLEIQLWKKNPEALFELMRKNPIRAQVEYVLGKAEVPRTG